MLEDTDVASAAYTVEEGVGRTVRNCDWSADTAGVVIVELEASITNTADGVVVSIGWASWDFLTSSSDVLST